MPTREKASGMKAARIVRRKPASATSISISISTFASGGNSPQYAGALARLASPPPDDREVICPTGCPAIFVSSPVSKNFLLYRLSPCGRGLGGAAYRWAVTPHPDRICDAIRPLPQGGEVTPSISFPSLREAATNQSMLSSRRDGLLRGVWHRARLRATRWFAMTESTGGDGSHYGTPLGRRLIRKT